MRILTATLTVALLGLAPALHAQTQPDGAAQPAEAPSEGNEPAEDETTETESAGEGESGGADSESAPDSDDADDAESSSDAVSDDEPAPQPEPKADPEPTAETAPTRGLDEFLAMARDNAAVLDEHAAKVERARWQKYRAKWAWGPKLRSDTTVAPVPANAELDDFGANVDEFFSLDVGPYIRESATVVLPVYTFGRINVARQLADLGIDSAELQKERALRDLEFQVKRAYYSIQLSNSFDALLSDGSTLIKDKLTEMEDARDFGEADFDTEDLRKLQVFDAEIDSRVLDNQKLGDIARAGLRYLAEFEGKIHVGELDEDDEPAVLHDLEKYYELAEEHRTELALLDTAVEARDLQLKLERRNAFPNVFVAANIGAGWSTEDLALRQVCRKPTPDSACIDTDDLFSKPYSDPLNFFSFGIALGMRWQFDFWQHRGKVKEVKAQNDEVAAQRRRARGAIRLEIEKLHTDARIALAKVEVTNRRLEAARRWRDQFGLTMQTGGADIKDAVDPLRAYYEARALYLQARYEYSVARAALAQGVGLGALDTELNETQAGASQD